MATDKQQIDKFKDAARELECDDDEKRFKERLGKLILSPAPAEIEQDSATKKE